MMYVLVLNVFPVVKFLKAKKIPPKIKDFIKD